MYMTHKTMENLSHVSGYILVVEDSYVQAEILIMLLEDNGYVVKKAANGQIALETAQQEPPVLVISDILMPKMNGFEMTRKIRADPILTHVPVLLLTSLTEPGDVAQALSCGADTFVTKPYEDVFLLKKIRSLLEKKESLKKPNQVISPFKFTYEGQEYEIKADRERILAFLLTTYEITMDRNQSLIRSENELRDLNNHLEQRVEERTKDLMRSHQELQVSYDKLAAAEEELMQQYLLLAEQESRIRENETLLNDVGKIVQVGGWELNIETQIVRWTKETYWIHEIPEDESYYLSQAILFYDLPDRTLFEAAIQRCIETQEPYDLELRFTSAKGRHLWVRAIGHAVTTGDRVVKLMGTIQDITERKRIEDEIVLKNIILSTQQETSLDPILTVDEHGKIISYNQQFIDLWNIPDNIIASRKDEQILLSVQNKLENPGEFLDRITYLYEHPDEKSRDEIFLADGRALDRFSAPMYGKDGRYFGRVWYFRDITEQKLDEQKIWALNQDLESRVEERTNELNSANEDLRAFNEELTAIEEELKVQIEVTNEAYDALEKSENRFHAMFDKHDSVMLLIDPETGKIIDANLAAERFYNKSQADIRKQFIYDINTLPPEEITATLMEAVQEKNNCFTFPHRIANGEIRMVEVHSSPINIGGKTILFSIIHDITERKRTEEKLLRISDDFQFASNYAQSIVDTVREPLIVLNGSFEVISASQSFYKIFEVTPEATIGKVLYTLGDNQWNIPQLHKMLETVLPESTSFDNFEIKHNFPGIGHRNMLLNARRILSEIGTSELILLVIEDITDRIQTEEKLLRISDDFQFASNYAQSIVDTVREPLIVLNGSFEVISASQSFYKIFEVTPEATIGKVLYTLGDNLWDIPLLHKLLEMILPESTSFDNFEIEHQFPGIGHWNMLLNARRILSETGTSELILLVIEDITDRKKCRNRLKPLLLKKRHCLGRYTIGLRTISRLS
jgi:PAS domain S-box-containing protein